MKDQYIYIPAKRIDDTALSPLLREMTFSGMSKEMSAKVQKTQSHTQLHLEPLYMTIAIVRRARIWKTAAILKDNKMTVSMATVSRVY